MWHGLFDYNLFLPSHIGFILNIISICLVVSKKKVFKTIQPKWPLAKVTKWSWPLAFIGIEADCIFISDMIIVIEKCTVSAFSIQKPKVPNLTFPQIGQGQPRVMILTNLVVLSHLMLCSKFQGNWPSGSGEEDFLRFLPYLGMAAILVMWLGILE